MPKPENEASRTFAVVGTFVHSSDSAPLIVLRDFCIGINSGKIVFLQKNDNRLHDTLQQYDIPRENVSYLDQWQFVVPGFVDTHIHASQYPNCGKGLDEELLSWLHKYTFPTEAKFSDLNFATDAYNKVISRVVRNGTTTACYFATIDTDATLCLCDVIEKVGQRALVGKVNMDQNSPEYYKEETTQSVQDTIRFVQEVVNRDCPLIKPCITPRFAISCGMDLMKQLGQLAQLYQLHVQTHICETKDECSLVRKLYPENKSYTDVYDKAGLLTEKTVLAHGIYLSKEERTLIKQRRAGISHCPNSNLSIRSGLLDVRACFEDNIAVGLGTDLSGGYSPSIMDAMRTAISTSNTISIQQGSSYRPLDYKEVFRMATLGGARVLDMDDNIGNFEIGKDFDALLIDPRAKSSPMDVFENDTVEDIIQKFLFLGDDRNILKVFVAGNELLKNISMETVQHSTEGLLIE